MAMPENRDLSFDAFRGLAIIAVVAIHAAHLGGSPHSGGFLYYRQLLNFCIPAFFFISGYWVSRKPIDSLAGYKAFLWKRFSRIFVPYLFWSSLILGYSAVKMGNVDGYKTVLLLLTGGACVGYYFVIAIAQLYILTPVLQYLNRKLGGYGLILVLVFNMTCLLALYLSRLFNVIWHLPAALPFYSWIIYYEMGLFWKGHYERTVTPRKIRLFRPFILFAIVASLLISVMEVIIILSKYDNPDFAAFYTKFSTLLYSVCVILGFLFYREYFGRLPRLLITVGRYSFGTYLIHAIVLGLVVKIFNGIGIIHSFQPLHQLVLVATTLLICLVLIVAARSMLPKFIYRKILGF
jgi:probable poly-beta-1,6-N-acetyl-D-glucosamine export protein